MESMLAESSTNPAPSDGSCDRDDGLCEQTLPRGHHSVEWFARAASMLQNAN
jgi:hypothetical protein